MTVTPLSLSVVIPTKGRDTLQRCLESFRGQPGFIVPIVVHDTFEATDADIAKIQFLCLQNGVVYESFNAMYSDWGYPQLEHAYKSGIVKTDYIMNIGDDDIMVPSITGRMLEIMQIGGYHPYLFQARLHPSPHRGNTEPVVIWNDYDRSITRQCVTGQNLVVPNMSTVMGRMTDDFEFIRQTVEAWKGNVQWVPLVTCECF